eukprot:3929756-Rhodomonas_salina.1
MDCEIKPKPAVVRCGECGFSTLISNARSGRVSRWLKNNGKQLTRTAEAMPRQMEKTMSTRFSSSTDASRSLM